MIVLVTGGSGSGKSVYAENLAMKLGNDNLIYIATMMPYDEECRKRIDRHQNSRKDKGFVTIECYTDIRKLMLEGRQTVLLECMSNLMANEMYSHQGITQLDKIADVCEEIIDGIKHLASVCKHVIIVTNEVFSDDGHYEEETKNYIENLGTINHRIGTLASNVIEVVCGIPICIRGEINDMD